MRTLRILLIMIVTIIIVGHTACDQAAATGSVLTPSSEQLQQGAYLVTVLGCGNCHSPKQMVDGELKVISERTLSGYVPKATGNIDTKVLRNGWQLHRTDGTMMVGHWGISYASNITSDVTGIGSMDEEEFTRMIRYGNVHMPSGRPLVHGSLLKQYTRLKEEDIRSIYAYLRSTRPVANEVPSPVSVYDLFAKYGSPMHRIKN